MMHSADSSNSLDEETAALKADFESGLKLNMDLRHLDVKVYGNAAVVTGYVVGTSTAPSGVIEQVMNRRSAVLIKEGGKWKEVHLHSSPVISVPQQ
jgi:ketosteroid isomerase-like protein